MADVLRSPSVQQVVGILCTYRRTAALDLFFDRVAQQSRRLDLLVVVDNDSDPVVAATVAKRSSASMPMRYVASGNVGPAGAFETGLRVLTETVEPEALVVLFDDDDPPVDARQVSALVEELRSAVQSDPKVGGIGLSGGRLNERTGLLASPVGLPGLEQVDHLHGGYLPVYRLRALLDVGGMDSSFFYGFEELELGRRMHHRGWRLLVANELMNQVEHRYPKHEARRSPRVRMEVGDPVWSRFHKERNLLRILRRERLWSAVLMNVTLRQVVKPLVALPRRPRLATRRLILGLRATSAGLQQRGGVDPRYPPP